MKELFFAASSYYSTESLTPEIAFALLFELDYSYKNTRNIRFAYDFYQDACKAAKHLTKTEGKKCPVIRIAINPLSLDLQEEGDWHKLNFHGKKYSLFMKADISVGSVGEHPSEVRVLDATFDLTDSHTYKPTISFQYESLTMDKVYAELQSASAARLTVEEKKDSIAFVATPPATLPVNNPAASETSLVSLANVAPVAGSTATPASKPEQITIDNPMNVGKDLEADLAKLKEKKKNLKNENNLLKEKLRQQRDNAARRVRKIPKAFLDNIPKSLASFSLLAVCFSFITGMALTTAIAYTFSYFVLLAAVFSLSNLALNHFNKYFNPIRTQIVKLNEQREAYSEFSFALGCNLEKEKEPLFNEIKKLFPQYQTAEEELKTLLWLNPLLAGAVIRGSSESLEKEIKTKLRN